MSASELKPGVSKMVWRDPNADGDEAEVVLVTTEPDCDGFVCVRDNDDRLDVVRFDELHAIGEPTGRVVADEPWVQKVRSALVFTRDQIVKREDRINSSVMILWRNRIDAALALLPVPREDHVVDANKVVSDDEISWDIKTAHDPNLQWLHHARSQAHDWAIDPDLRDITLPSDEQLREQVRRAHADNAPPPSEAGTITHGGIQSAARAAEGGA
jgi:hypothetical protein